MGDVLAGWPALAVFVVAGVLALLLEAWDEAPADASARPGWRGRWSAARPWLGWLLPVLVVGAAALSVLRFATYLA